MKSESSLTTGQLASLAAPLLALCWLLPNHHMPWPDFYSDAWAACVMLMLAALLLWRTRQVQSYAWHTLPLIVLLCILIVWLQYATGLISTFGIAWTGSLYLGGFLLALMIGTICEQHHPKICADFLFLATLIGALFSLAIQIQQWLQINPGQFFWLFIPAPPSRFAANLGQPNQLASLLCLGVLSCAWLHQRGRLPGLAAWILAALLAAGIALTESRTSWMVVAMVWTGLLFWCKRLSIPRQLMLATLGWTGVFIFFIATLPYANQWIKGAQLQAVRTISSDELRFEMWSFLWKAIQQHPWTGYGWMQTSYAQFTANPYKILSDGTMRHAHNLILDLITWVGIPLGLMICVLLLFFIVQTVRRIQHIEHLWMMFFAAALGIHALLEFPLYYAYFLLPFGIMVGALTVSLQINPIMVSRTLPVVTLWIFISAGLILTVRDYLVIEDDFFALRFERQHLEPARESNAPDVLVLTHLQDVLWLARVDPSQAHTEKDLARALHTTKLLPSIVSIYKLATMYAFAAKTEQAEYWIIILTRLNRPSQKMVEELRHQWKTQAHHHSQMSKVIWPD